MIKLPFYAKINKNIIYFIMRRIKLLILLNRNQIIYLGLKHCINKKMVLLLLLYKIINFDINRITKLLSLSYINK